MSDKGIFPQPDESGQNSMNLEPSFPVDQVPGLDELFDKLDLLVSSWNLSQMIGGLLAGEVDSYLYEMFGEELDELDEEVVDEAVTKIIQEHFLGFISGTQSLLYAIFSQIALLLMTNQGPELRDTLREQVIVELEMLRRDAEGLGYSPDGLRVLITGCGNDFTKHLELNGMGESIVVFTEARHTVTVHVNYLEMCSRVPSDLKETVEQLALDLAKVRGDETEAERNDIVVNILRKFETLQNKDVLSKFISEFIALIKAKVTGDNNKPRKAKYAVAISVLEAVNARTFPPATE